MDQKTVEDRRLSSQDTSRLRATQNDPSGLYQVEVFGNALAGSVSFCFPSWKSLGGYPLIWQSRQGRSSPLLLAAKPDILRASSWIDCMICGLP